MTEAVVCKDEFSDYTDIDYDDILKFDSNALNDFFEYDEHFFQVLRKATCTDGDMKLGLEALKLILDPNATCFQSIFGYFTILAMAARVERNSETTI